ncbi:MAG: hypothetical protein HC824_21210 [Synechococcales cyanobacterium RM1_1_8]|nr:hypothetical protein [Synechococcales cyanobacterium RM1_1_8]
MADSIWIVTSTVAPGPPLPEETTRIAKGFQSSHQRAVESTAQAVKVEKLEQQMGEFLQAMGKIFDQAETQAQQKQGLHLAEIELSAEISAEGEVRLVGIAGAKTAGKGAITLTFRRH